MSEVDTARMSWNPDKKIYSEILSLLEQADSRDSTVQRRIAETITSLDNVSDSLCYYARIFVDPELPNVEIRQRAGLLLKAKISLFINSQQSNGVSGKAVEVDAPNQMRLFTLDYVKQNAMKAIWDTDKTIRSTGGTILTTLVSCSSQELSLQIFSDVFPVLLDSVNESGGDISESAMGAMTKIVEDEVNKKAYKQKQADASRGFSSTEFSISSTPFFTSRFLPSLFHLTVHSPSVTLRHQALTCLNHFERGRFFNEGNCFSTLFKDYWHVLGVVAVEKEPSLKLGALIGMTQVAKYNVEVIISNMVSIVNFLLECLEFEQPYDLKLAALDLLCDMIKQPATHSAIGFIMPTLLPMLVENTRYSQWDYLQMNVDQFKDDDESCVPKKSDPFANSDTSKPRYPKSSALQTSEKRKEQKRRDSLQKKCEGNGLEPESGFSEGDSAEDEFEDELDKSSFGTWGSAWTVRKAAASIIDHMSSIYGHAVLPHIFGFIEMRLSDANWEIRETSVLTLGAIASGCIDALEPFLPKIIELLIVMCEDSKPVLRSISCWTLSRFSLWISPNKEVLTVVCDTLLKHVLDRNKCVQEAACSALACLIEESGHAMIPFLGIITDVFHQALLTFESHSVVLLLDSIGTLALTLGSYIDTEEFHIKIVDMLFQKFDSLERRDPVLIVLLECISCVLPSIKPGVGRYMHLLVRKSLCIIEQCIDETQENVVKISPSYPMNQDILECVLDFLASVCETVSFEIKPFLTKEFLDVVEKCCFIDADLMPEEVSPVKECVFGLVGDLAECAPEVIQQKLSSIIVVLIRDIQTPNPAVCQNASWAIGQLAVSGIRRQLDVYADAILDQLISAISARASSEDVIKTHFTTVSRLACLYPRKCNQKMWNHFASWCKSIEANENAHEKLTAIRGICGVVEVDLSIALSSLAPFLNCVCSLFPGDISPVSLSEELASLFRTASQIFQYVKNSYPQEWEAASSHVSEWHTHSFNSLTSNRGSSQGLYAGA